jgi:hypothetical protein
MHRINVFIKDEQLEFFKHKEGTISENLRKAIDEIMDKELKQGALSKSKEGGKNE